MSLLHTEFAQALPASPSLMIIFGAGEDLTKRKLIPALFHLCSARLLPDGFAVLGMDRLDMDDATFRNLLAERVRDYARARAVGGG